MLVEQSDLLKCLDVFEEKEVELLSYGDTSGFFTKDEALELISQTVPHLYAEDVYLEMLDQAFLSIVPHPEGLTILRSRMGEAMNLYRSLRQWFHGKSVEESKTLVSDFRFVRRPRSFPDRKFLLSDVVTEWKNDYSLSQNQIHSLELLLSPVESFRLAGFQTRSTSRILQKWGQHSNPSKYSTGTIVCAGTGSGKTLAFYLPAMASLAEDIIANNNAHVRILAIYPRKELLKDQFMETWEQCRKLDATMLERAGRKISIGAYFGDTKKTISAAQKFLSSSAKSSIEFDLLRCKTKKCKGKMEWRKVSIDADVEELKCSICSHGVSADEVKLTRDSQAKNPPDILFTTTEMLNQHMSNSFHNHLFGVGNKEPGPTLVLLDEVHTYAGNSGAQVGYTLRRWMQLARCRPHFVGLSATLADADSFFGNLVGARPNDVALIQPTEEEMIEEGAEYMLALRGDPVSKTALLSTSIQASMLTHRILDSSEKRSKGTWGTKLFAFTDDLDVKNRLYHGLSDAEGWRTGFNGSTQHAEPLAILRAPDASYKKIQLGQNWRVAEDIGHVFYGPGARVSETSSQSAGADSNSDIIVATASLEVGFNDPEVGAVIQHKAPRSVSSYIQRKGRAGRQRVMRPWMLVVLSAFGRDRVAFQRYEDLISPEINRQGLPFQNAHIQKMQAALACLDYFSKSLGRVDIWALLKPYSYAQNSQVAKRKSLLELVSKTIDGSGQAEFETYIKFALQLTDEQLQVVLWGTPRSIMLEFLPSLKRMLETDFSSFGRKWSDINYSSRSPLPQFIPDALFSELNLSSLSISLLRGQSKVEINESLPFFQGLREFAPGRISKRYASKSDLDADWLVPESFKPNAGEYQEVAFELTDAFGYRLQPEVFVTGPEGKSLPIYKPQDILTKPLDFRMGLSPKSNASILWGVEFGNLVNATPQKAPVGIWQKYIRDFTFCTHQQMSPLEVTRYSTGSIASLRFKQGSSSHAKFLWKLDGSDAGVGIRQWVDGLRIRLQIDLETLNQITTNAEVIRGVRPVYFQHLVAKQKAFEFDKFTAEWLCECYLAAVAGELISGKHDSIEAVIAFLGSDAGISILQAIPSSLFQADMLDETELNAEQKLQEELRDKLGDKEILLLLEQCAMSLIRPLHADVEFASWAKQVLANSIAAVMQQALCVLLPDADERSVIVDTRWAGEQDDILEVWMSESEPGGIGIISELSDLYRTDPLRVLNIVMYATQPGQYEQIDYDLYNLLEELSHNEKLKLALEDVRLANSYKERCLAIKALFTKLQKAGFVISHSFKAVLFSRVLKPGSSEMTDLEILKLLKGWKVLEEQLGSECSLNIASHALAVADESEENEFAIFSRLSRYQNLLWPRGSSIRGTELNYFNMFQAENRHTERLMVEVLFKEHIPQINIEDDSWLERLHEVLKASGNADLRVERNNLTQIIKIITTINLEQIDHLGLLLHPRIGGVKWDKGSLLVRVELAESLQ